MLRKLFLSICLFAGHNSFSQDISGTWYGFQTSRNKGEFKEYRISVDFNSTVGNEISGTMTIKASEKGSIISKFTGKFDQKKKTLFIKENEVVTSGLNEKDFSLCEFALKVEDKRIKGKGHATNKGYDHLEIYLQRNPNY